MTRKQASRIVKKLNRYWRMYEREYQSALGFMPFDSRRFVTRKGKTYAPYARTRISKHDVLNKGGG